MKIGERFKGNKVTLEVVEEIDGCNGCYFRHFTNCSPVYVLVDECVGMHREDGMDVIFKKVEE